MNIESEGNDVKPFEDIIPELLFLGFKDTWVSFDRAGGVHGRQYVYRLWDGLIIVMTDGCVASVVSMHKVGHTEYHTKEALLEAVVALINEIRERYDD